jgi:HlyD family secretion protein
VEVDETDIPNVRLGQVAKVTVDAIHEKTFTGKVTEIGNSPIQAAGQSAGTSQATNFKVVVQLDGEIPEVRPGFTCTAEITTDTRQGVMSVPIQALAVREITRNAKGEIVRPEQKTGSRRSAMPTASAQELPPGHTRKEEEGVFLVREGRAEFVPVKTGIAGDKYFEFVSGSLKEGDQVITGPFASVRNLRDGDMVKIQPVEGVPQR